MLYNNPKTLLDSISKIVSEDRKKYQEERDQLEGKIQLEAMSKMKMEYVVPEEIEKESRAHFMGAAAAAHKSGKKNFSFAGKTYPVQIQHHVAKQVNERLTGNQHKIDANKNGKVDAHDFKLLRKEETDLIESHFKVGDEVKCKASGMEGKVIKLDEPETGKYYTVKREDGKTMKYAPDELVKEKEEMGEATKSQETQFHSKLDKLVHKTFGKRANESVKIDEISKKTLGSYVNKASVDMANRTAEGERKRTLAGADYAHNISRGMDQKTAEAGMKKDREAAKPDVVKAVKRMHNINKAVSRLTKEEVEIEEAKKPVKKMKEGLWDTIKSAMTGANPYGSGQRTGTSVYNPSTGRYEERTPGVEEGILDTIKQAFSSNNSASNVTTVSNKDYKPSVDYSQKDRVKVPSSGWNNVRPSAPNMSGTGMKRYNSSTGTYEEKDTPGQHMCALHVKHSTLGEGKTLFSQHADPAEDGTIEWYDVMFEHGIEKQVPTSDLEILVQESHGNHTKGKK